MKDPLSLFPFAAAFPLPVSIMPSENAAAGNTPLFVYVGTYTREASRGIHLFRMDPRTGRWEDNGLAAEVENPSFVAPHPARNLLFAVGNTTGPDGRPAGTVSAFSIDPASGKLTLLNRRSTGGSGPCHISVTPRGNAVLVANYGAGSVAGFPILNDGSLGARRGFRQHNGSGPNPERQEGPHAHSINADPSGRFALAADLGLDRILIYRIGENGELNDNEPPEAALAGGAGPRHLAFHPHKPFAYVINELDSTMTAFSFDARTGELRELQTIPTLPEDFSRTNWPAEVLPHPSGRYLYGSNRGHDSIVIYRIADGGTLETVGHEPTRGKNPRNFGIDPAGRFLFAAHQDTHNIVPFAIDGNTGKLKATGDTYTVSMPVCVRFWRPGN